VLSLTAPEIAEQGAIVDVFAPRKTVVLLPKHLAGLTVYLKVLAGIMLSV